MFHKLQQLSGVHSPPSRSLPMLPCWGEEGYAGHTLCQEIGPIFRQSSTSISWSSGRCYCPLNISGIYPAQCPSCTVLELVPRQCHCPHGRISSRPGQFSCGFPVAGQASTVRMDAAPAGHGESAPEPGPTSGGPICIEPQQSAPTVLFESQGSSRLENRRVLLQLGEDQGLCVPADSHDPTSPMQDLTGPSDRPSDSPVVAEEDLVSRRCQPSHGLPQEPSDPTLDLLVQPLSGTLHHDPGCLHLTAWPLSGKIVERQDFQSALQSSSAGQEAIVQGATPHAHDTRSISTSWALFNGVSLEEIMRAAYWQFKNLFMAFIYATSRRRRHPFPRPLCLLPYGRLISLPPRCCMGASWAALLCWSSTGKEKRTDGFLLM